MGTARALSGRAETPDFPYQTRVSGRGLPRRGEGNARRKSRPSSCSSRGRR